MNTNAPPMNQLSTVRPLPAPRLTGRLLAPVPIAPLIYMRVLFGTVMLWEVIRYFGYGWIGRYFIVPTHHFTYYGFEWVRPWPGGGMYFHFVVMGVLAVCMTIGLWYRAAAALFFLGFTYVFLLEQTLYLNHFYLVCLLSFLMIFLPAHRAVSVDAWLRPGLRSESAPAWTLWLLRAQLGIVYFYGGIAKLNWDWLQGEPMRMWLATRTGFPVVGPLFTHELAVAFFTYGGLLLDLLIVPLLLWRPTRPFALGAAALFHFLNSVLFRIGIFPWLMLGATLLFLPAATWHRLLWGPQAEGQKPGMEAGEPGNPSQNALMGRVTLVLVGGFVLLQLLLPFRHFLYDGNVSWTEEGHRFSWRMKLRTKWADARFVITDPATGQRWEADPLDYLEYWQARKAFTHPDMVLQLSHMLASDYRERVGGPVEVRARVLASLNGRRPQLLIDPEVNLAAERRSLWPTKWIVPLTEPLRPSVGVADPAAGGSGGIEDM